MPRANTEESKAGARRCNAEWIARNPDHYRRLSAARSAKFRERNPEKHKAITKRFYHKHKDEILEKKKSMRYVFALSSAKRRAKDRGLPFDLDREWFLSMEALGSALSGIPFSRDETQSSVFYPYGPSIDKIIPELGYVKSNCRLVLRVENAFKSILTDAEMLVIARAMIAKADEGLT